MHPLRRPLAAVAVAAALGAGCGDPGAPDLGVIPPSTTSTTARPALAADGGAAGASPVAGDDATPFVAQLTPNRPPDFRPEVLLTTDDGVGIAGGPMLLPGVDAERALDDPTGGVVVEVPVGDDHQIVWFPAGGDGDQVITQGDDRLMDVGFADGAVLAVVADAQRIRLLGLGGEQQERTLLELAPGTTATSVSAAAGLYAVVLNDDACGALQFLGPDGAPLDIGGVTAPVCLFPGRGRFGHVAFSPDGETFAYTERTFGPDGALAGTELVVRDLAGTEWYRGTVGTADQRITSLAFDRSLVLLLRHTAEGPELVRFDVRQPADVAVTKVEGARAATFTRVPPALPPAG